MADIEEINIEYSDFTLPLPNFITDTDKDMFLGNPSNQAYLKPRTSLMLRGTIWGVRNGTYQLPHDCGFTSSKSDYLVPRQPDQVYGVMCPLIVPDAFNVPHFWDGTMPKLIQALPLLLNSKVKLLVETPKQVS